MTAVELTSMTEEEFSSYFDEKVERYTEVLSHHVHEEGEEPVVKAAKQLKALLPEGVNTPNHYLFNVNHGSKRIGFVWLKVELNKKSAFLYEIYLFDEYRGKGFGSQVMNDIEKWLIKKGVNYFKLHVFGSNTGARKLYEELGFDLMGINMMKPIGPS
ncbi:GNAT family N-acetyltransferase [Bacillus spongiae]|uniref:GNAT family N-acetyltransferase n=1 Tax=Bacillus spongiae TaxID=2683610 RepID=A0ABU8HBW7_9BACI